MNKNESYKSLFHPAIAGWFEERVGKPTPVQSLAWPEIASGRHVLVSAPTGSGKTLTAFLWAINQLASGIWERGGIRVLYISPMKALNNDVRKNLMQPLAELEEYFTRHGEMFNPVRVLTRSGDTPQEERRKMLKHPPEILITTPESLNILLSSEKGRGLFQGVKTVIMDEIHALIGEKRGTHMITAVDRLVMESGEFQRIALSATVKPLALAADFSGGFILKGKGTGIQVLYEKRKVSVIEAKTAKEYLINIRFPAAAGPDREDKSRWPALAEEFAGIIRKNRSTLLFTNSRALAEKVARLINENMGGNAVYSHHSSLSRELRLVVEEKFKRGDLRGIVATSSLELGIDIGDLDEVVLVQSPFSISSAVQRVGRSGHRAGAASRGTLYPTHGRDFVDAAVIAESIARQDIEEIRPVECPLDVLSQVVLSMAMNGPMDIDDMFHTIKTSYPYRDLSTRQFKSVLDMLAGKYAGTRMRELEPRVSLDLLDNTVAGKRGNRMLLFMSGGTIPDRGYFDLRIHDSGDKIGELDEEFVWERGLGESFALGVHSWKIMKITHNDVEVVPAGRSPGMVPFWKAEARNRDFHFSRKIGLFMEHASGRLGREEFIGELRTKYFMEEPAAMELSGFLTRQMEATGGELPHRHHVLIEHFDDAANRSGSKQVIIHTLWGGRVNRPFAMALSAAWEKRYSWSLETFVNNDSIMLMLPHEFKSADIFSMVTSGNVDSLVGEKLENTGFFGSRFRENAGRALLLPRGGFRKRMPLWLNRLRSKKLLDAVSRYDDFPILLETWRTCLQDEFDMGSLKALLEEIRGGTIRVTEAVTGYPSPLSSDIVYRQTNKYMYEDDSPVPGGKSSLKGSLIKEVAASSSLRPLFPGWLLDMFDERIKRTAPGYTPSASADLLDWLKERYFIPAGEWGLLLSSVKRDHGDDPESMVREISGKAVVITFPGSGLELLCAVENLAKTAKAFEIAIEDLVMRRVMDDDPSDKERFRESAAETARSVGVGGLLGYDPVSREEILLQWLSYYGPMGIPDIRNIFGLKEPDLMALLEELEEDGAVVLDRFREGPDDIEVCTNENLEMLLRMLRRERRPSFEALELDYLQPFIALSQGVVPLYDVHEDDAGARRGEPAKETLMDRMERLFGYPASAEAWEEYILPARVEGYRPAWLDELMHTGGLVWYGCGTRKISFALRDELDIFMDDGTGNIGDDDDGTGKPAPLFPDARGRYRFFDIAGHSGMSTTETAEKLWDLSWKGLVANDSYAVIRNGILGRFVTAGTDAADRPGRGRGFGRWKSSRQIDGYWYLLPVHEEQRDSMEHEELMRERARQLLDRYGILFRELTEREAGSMAWSGIFRSLRIMELSGEILSGHFFKGIPGPQFMTPESFRSLEKTATRDAVFWINAADPASLCGARLEGLKDKLPSRLASTFMVFHGTRPVLTVRRNGSVLEFNCSHDDPQMGIYCKVFDALMERGFNPEKTIAVKEINGVPAGESIYAVPLMAHGFIRNFRDLELRKKY